ncbi:MAG: VWA domain-containing protein [Dehalococcoidia bacterium]|nr:VWA domain-containing protein [Dehalococcoidia bacterium]
MKLERSVSWGIAPALVTLMLVLASFVPATGGTPVVRAQAPQCGPMDVAFIIDSTGSMGGAINNVKSELGAILGDIAAASGNDYSLAVVRFEDNVTIDETFAPNNQASAAADISAMIASGGLNEPEASDESLNTVVNALAAAGRPQNIDFTPAYRAGALKIAVLVTDARPGGFDDEYVAGTDDVNAHNVALAAAAQGIKISAIHVPGGFDGTTAVIMNDYATTSGGRYVLTAPDGSGTGTAIREIINACGSGEGPDLVVTKTPKPGQPAPRPGGLYSFIIQVTNEGTDPTPPPPTDVTLRDDLSGIGSFSSWTANSGNCYSSRPYVNCSRGRLNPGQTWWVEITVRLPRTCGEYINRVTVDPNDTIPETNEANNAAELLVDVPCITSHIPSWYELIGGGTPDGATAGSGVVARARFATI